MGYQIKPKDKVSQTFWEYLPEGILSFMAQPCAKIIDKGECDTIKRLFEVEE